MANRTDRADERRATHGEPVWVPDLDRWNCTGNCETEFQCVDGLTLKDFIGVDNLTMHKWLVNHELMSTKWTKKY